MSVHSRDNDSTNGLILLEQNSMWVVTFAGFVTFLDVTFQHHTSSIIAYSQHAWWGVCVMFCRV